MRDCRPVGPYSDVIEALSQLDPTIPILLGISLNTFRRYEKWRLFASFAQYYGVVQCNMRQARHVFQGLKRPLAVGDDMRADKRVFVYSWKPQVDYEWEGSPFNGKPVSRDPKAGTVFVVLMCLQAGPSGVQGAIEKWNWVRDLRKLPIAGSSVTNERYGVEADE